MSQKLISIALWVWAGVTVLSLACAIIFGVMLTHKAAPVEHWYTNQGKVIYKDRPVYTNINWMAITNDVLRIAISNIIYGYANSDIHLVTSNTVVIGNMMTLYQWAYHYATTNLIKTDKIYVPQYNWGFTLGYPYMVGAFVRPLNFLDGIAGAEIGTSTDFKELNWHVYVGWMFR